MEGELMGSGVLQIYNDSKKTGLLFWFLVPVYRICKVNSPSAIGLYLKVPKREIFDRSDFPDFYIIKSLCGGDFGFK